jgi:photolyase PhrII
MVKWLPIHLSERIRVVKNASIRPEREFVLYWMHHAVRSHENPALDIALGIAARTELPVLVYQGLSGRHPYNSDRHHTFIMEGARELQQSLKARGIAYVFNLGRRPTEPSPLKKLARRAAAVITEDFPAPPFPKWTRKLASGMDTAVWAVDCACLIPMRLITRPFARAYEFRHYTQKEYERRLTQSWQDAAVVSDVFKGECGFEAIDLASVELADLCAQCEIDHTVPPVAHTPGGSSAGYARWSDFKRWALKDYGRLRNDAALVFPRGVSRLSAYLHHGHVSPFRIAREAACVHSVGCDKFLEELLVWRELAHNFCFHQQRPETLDGLPRWARETLRHHQNDIREAVYSWETLFRGRTSDALWDAAQKSLLVHGELHNNVRMTWGKAFLNWTRDPQEALDLMIDLNHRLALDGSDANSYGGLLWCLGLFDRPFKPERPVIGMLRPRYTKDHAQRLDMPAYIAKVKGPVTGEPLKIAVVGAGVSGLFAARALMDHGHQVQVFERNGMPGGRTATITGPNLAFDTGTQYFTVRDDRFARYVRSWEADGIVERWEGKVVIAKAGSLADENRKPERWVGVPSMVVVPEHLSTGISVQFNTAIVSTRRNKGRWQLTDDLQNVYGLYDVLIVAVPPPGARGLVETSPLLCARLAGIEMLPCLAMMASFEGPLDVPFDAAFIHDSRLKWAARNNSKPGRDTSECWVFHFNAGWSATNADDNDESLWDSTMDAFSADTGCGPIESTYLRSKYWKYAVAARPLNAGSIWDADLKIGLCGDWCHMSRLEGAALSGMAMAGRILNSKAGMRPDLKDPDP